MISVVLRELKARRPTTLPELAAVRFRMTLAVVVVAALGSVPVASGRLGGEAFATPRAMTRQADASGDPESPISVAVRAGRDPERALLSRLSLRRFRGTVRRLAAFGTRYWSTPGNAAARDWIESQLKEYGYDVQRHPFRASGRDGREPELEIDSVYATKVGSTRPSHMYLVSAHMDSTSFDSPDRSFAPGANDDGSGTALVLELARVLGGGDVDVAQSVRFVLWNAEEIGLVGSRAYVHDRAALQGIEDPPGSGRYPEPVWLGIIQHDMLLFDHGMPLQSTGAPADRQIAAADIDIEFDADQPFDGGAQELAARLLAANGRHLRRYPAEVGQFMQSTDSVPFAPFCPAVSVRENERRDEIGLGSDPHWHRSSDVVASYRREDFRLGYEALRMTTAAIADLAGARIVEASDGRR